MKKKPPKQDQHQDAVKNELESLSKIFDGVDLSQDEFRKAVKKLFEEKDEVLKRLSDS